MAQREFSIELKSSLMKTMGPGENKTDLVPVQSSDSAREHEKVLCILRDMTDATRCHKINLNMPATTTAKEFCDDVAKQYGYVPNTFSVVYEGGHDEVFINELGNEILGDICENSGNGKKNNFTIREKDEMSPVKAETEQATGISGSMDNLSLGYTPLTSVENKETYTTSGTSDYTYSSYSSALIKSDTGYVGLVNQAMTCYLNSLLQTLYMTPEFRNALYRWEFDDKEDPAKSIPYQLQRLFLHLQTSKRRAVETTEVTKSFGWDSSEAWQQHDVQELCRVMFDALETKWKNTDQEHLINELYQGKMKDYVKCLECNYESARVDAYLDIPLVIRPFGSNQAYGSVGEALDAFVQYETLDGSNQYFCEKCNKKCDAHKGLKFVSFPYLLTLQLKRFDFDYNTMHRIKLNDKMTFPEILNLNYLVKKDADDEVKAEDADDEGTELGKADAGEDGSPAADSDVVEDVDQGVDIAGQAIDSDEAVDEGIDMENCASGTSTNSETSLNSEALANDKNASEMDNDGPYVYELFSIMIHSGSAAGGHYYAYIKSFKDGDWYSFNDQHVTKITYDDIRKTYGGSSSSRGYYSAAYTSSTNAYMLMYRQINKEKNKDFMKVEEFPEHLQGELDTLREKEEIDKKQKEMEKSMCKSQCIDILRGIEEFQRKKSDKSENTTICKIKLYGIHPITKKMMDTKLEVHKDKTLSEATEIARKLFELDVPLDCCRLVKYDEFHDSLEKSFENEEDLTMGSILGGVKSTYMFDLLLETKRPDQHFQVYKPGGVTAKVFLVDVTTETIHDPVTVRAYLTDTVAEFKNLVKTMLELDAQHMRVVFERYYSDLRFLTVPNKTLKSEGFFRSNKVFVECLKSEEEMETPFVQTKLYKLLDRYENTIRLQIMLPPEEEVQAVNEKHKTKLLTKNGHILTKDNTDTRCNENSSPDTDEGIGEGDEVEIYNRTTLQSNHINHTTSSVEQLKNYDEGGGGDTVVEKSDVNTKVEKSETEWSEGIVNGDCITGSENTDSKSAKLDSASTELDSKSSELDLQSAETTNCISNYETAASSPSSMTTDFARTPEESSKEFSDRLQKECTENWDDEIDQNTSASYSYGTSGGTMATIHNNEQDPEEEARYFKANFVAGTDSAQRGLSVEVDKRITVGALKKELEYYVGTTMENFKVFRVYSNNQEFETTRLSESLSSYGDDSRLNIKLGRALKKGEYRAKVFQLLKNEAEPVKFLFDAIFAKGQTVLDSKYIIQDEMKNQQMIDVPIDRLRLRKKTWRNPGSIYLDTQVYDEDIPVFANWELFVEIIENPEPLTSLSQVAIFVKRWRPSKFELDPFDEIVLNTSSIDELKQKLSEISDIQPDNIEFAKGRSTFPCEVSLLDINTDLEWNPQVTALNVWPLYICDDGSVLYYRDKSEETLELSEEKKKEIQQKESFRTRISQRVMYSPRKERALKIYTDDTPSSANASDLD